MQDLHERSDERDPGDGLITDAAIDDAVSQEHPATADAPTREEPKPRIDDSPAPARRPEPARRQETARDAEPPADDKGNGPKGGEPKKPAKKGSRLPLIILAIVAVIGAIVGTWYWWSTRDLQGTDDAYTDGHVVTVAPRVSGQVSVLAVTDNQFVHKGDLLVQLDPRDYQAARDQAAGQLATAEGELSNAQFGAEVARQTFPARLAAAQAQLGVAQANLFKARTDYQRQHNIARAATTQEAVDTSTAALQQMQAQVTQAEANVREAQPVQPNINQADASVKRLQGQIQQAQAQLAQADLNLSYTRVVAPQDGWVTKRNVEVGNYVQPAQGILSLVSPEVWITANFKETELNRIRPGQRVDVDVDAYGKVHLEGHVDSVQMGSGAQFSAFPAENATGNFVKIVRRVPVKIVIDKGLDPKVPLPLGISVDPTIHLTRPTS